MTIANIVTAGNRGEGTGGAYVWGFNQSGEVVWSYDTASSTLKCVVLAPDGYYYVCGSAADNDDGNGTRNIWKFDNGGNYISGANLDSSASLSHLRVDASYVYVVSSNGKALRTALDFTGSETIFSGGVTCIDIDNSGNMYIGRGSSQDNLFKYNSAKVLQWQVASGVSNVVRSVQGLANGHVVTGSNSGVVKYYIDGSSPDAGEWSWSFPTKGFATVYSDSSNNIYACRSNRQTANEQKFVCLNTSGVEQWGITPGYGDLDSMIFIGSKLFVVGDFSLSTNVFEVNLTTHKLNPLLATPRFQELYGIAGSSFSWQPKLSDDLELFIPCNDDASNTTIIDKSGNNRNGTGFYNTELMSGTGKINKALISDISMAMESVVGGSQIGSVTSLSSMYGFAFTPRNNHLVSTISVRISRDLDTILPLLLKIYATDGAGKPTGSVLATGSILASEVETSASVKMITLDSGFNFVGGSTYAVVFNINSAFSTYGYRFYGATSNYYGSTKGWQLASYDGGSTWDVYTSYIMYFRINEFRDHLASFANIDAINLPVGKKLTISFWVKWNKDYGNSSGDQYSIVKRNKTNGSGWLVRMGNTGPAIRAQVYDAANLYESNVAISLGIWHLVVIRIDRNSQISISLDNRTLVDSDNIYSIIAVDLSNTEELNLAPAFDVTNLNGFDGELDAIAIHSRILTGAEEERLWNNGDGTENLDLGPEIIDQSADTDIDYLDNVEFFVTASGDDLIYQWYKDDTELTGETESTLQLTAVDINDAGTYYCIVSNPSGSVQTTDIELRISPYIISQTNSFAAALNSQVTLTVTAAGSGTLAYQWYKNDVLLAGETNLNITFMASSSKTGTYKCIITNLVGSTESADIVLTTAVNPYHFNIFNWQSDMDRLI